MTKEEFIQIAPEEMRFTHEEVLVQAEEVCQNVASAIPDFATPAQSRVAIENMIEIYGLATKSLQLMLDTKKPTLH